jgi:hypothetical protein
MHRHLRVHGLPPLPPCRALTRCPSHAQWRFSELNPNRQRLAEDMSAAATPQARPARPAGAERAVKPAGEPATTRVHVHTHPSSS